MSSKAQPSAWIVRVGMAHRRLVLSAALGLAAGLAAAYAARLEAVTSALIGWDLGILIYLAAAAWMMARCSTVPAIRKNAAIQDEGAFAILVLAVVAAIASMGAIFVEISIIKRAPNYTAYLPLVIATVILSWAFTHTIFALHYAHDYYGGGASKQGLKFPDDSQPDYWDFVYFSFVVGMTFQVSDVVVTNKSVRRMVVAHGVLSFLFSTAIVAMTVNIAAGLFQK